MTDTVIGHAGKLSDSMDNFKPHDEVHPMTGKEVLEAAKNVKKKEALRYDSGKFRFTLMFAIMKTELVRVFTMGAIKYEDNNWFLGMPYSKCMDSLERHWTKWQMGQSVDKETGCHHLAQVAWNALVLMVYEMCGKGVDDRVMPLEIDDNFYYISGNSLCKELGLKGKDLEDYVKKYGRKK